MSIYPPPTDPNNPVFNTDNWETTTTSSGSSVDIAFLDANYVQYPTADSASTQYFSNSSSLGNLTINDPQSLICNTFNTDSVATTTNLFTTTVGSGFKIRLSGSQSAGYTTDIGTDTNTNQVANLSVLGTALNPIDLATDLNIGDQQIDGVLNIGTASSRTATINIGTGSTGVKTINIGASGDNLTLSGLYLRTNSVNNTPNSFVYINSAPTLNFNTFSNEGLVVNSSATTGEYSLFTPDTLRDYCLTCYNNNDFYSFPFTSNVNQFVFNQDTDFNYVILAYSVVVFYFSVAEGKIYVLSDTTKLYQPKVLGYSTTVLPTFTSLQNGYVASNTSASVSRGGGTAGGGAISISGALPIGVYYIEVQGRINCSIAGTNFRLNGWGVFASTASGDVNTTINNIGLRQEFYSQQLVNLVGNKLTQTVSGYWVNTTAGAVIYGGFTIYPTSNTGTTFTFESTLKITRIG